MLNKTSIIIPCYFADDSYKDMTARCLEGLKDFDGEIVVVDDGSPLECDLSTIRRKENGGFGAAVNSGLLEATGDILIVCNNDIEFIQPNWLKHLLEPLRKGYDISTIRSTEPDGWETRDWIEPDANFGCIFAMKRIVYETIGGFDETLGKGYHEDADFRRRAMEAGFKIAKNHNGLVHHLGKATYKVVDPEDSMFFESREKLKKKWGEVF